jgi:preprotein translocase subunit SecF
MRPIKLVPDNTNIPFLSYRWLALGVSIVLLIASFALVATRGLNWGIDFVGGQSMRVTFAKPVDIGQLRSQLEKLNVGDVVIQQIGKPNEVSIRVPLEGGQNPIGKCLGAGSGERAIKGDANRISSKVRADVLRAFPDARIGSVNAVSGKVGCELFSTGSIALGLAMLGISLFIWFRFEWQFGVGALITLFHDVVLTFGFFALTQLPFDLNIVAAVLTIIGYSLNDTIVVYDRIRETLRKFRKMEMEALLDLSVNETLSRTVTTSLSLILTLAVLLFLGPDTIFGFTAAMLLGFVVGTFSSIYISAPVLIWLNVGPDSFLASTTDSNGMGKAERVRREEGVV